MRRELLTNPALLAQRIADELTRRRRLRRMRGTPCAELQAPHLDTLELLDLVQRRFAPRVIYDIGANAGTWTLLARTICPQAEVHAFEPLEALHTAYHARAASVGRATLHGIALGPATADRTMYVHHFADASSFIPLAPAEASKWPGHLREERVVHVHALDEYAASHGLPPADLLKLDVQGFELEVLKGAPSTLANASAVISEVSFREIYSGQPQFGDVAAVLATHGFKVRAFGFGIAPGVVIDQADVLFTRES